MSAQSAKKKRLGSRRRVGHQNEMSKTDDSHGTGSTFVAERHIPEENTDSLNALADFDNSHSETQHPPSPELLGNRRKLGSRRRNKEQHVKDSVTESYHEPREEVEHTTRGLAIQAERQADASSDYSSEAQNVNTTNCSEADLESFSSKSENLQADLEENETDSEVISDSSKFVKDMQEGIDKSDLHNEEVKESAHLVGISELTSLSVLSCPTVDQQLIDQSNYREKLCDSPTNQDISIPDSIQDGNVEALEWRNEDYDVYDTKEPQISDIERVDTALSQVFEMEGRVEGDTKPSAEQTGQQEQEGLLSEPEESASSLQTLQSEVNVPFDSQHQPNDTSFNSIGNRRKLGSSRRNKGRQHVKDSVAESDHEPTEDVVGNIGDNETLETTEMTLIIETAVQEKSMETLLEETDKFDTAQTEDVTDQVKENAQDGTLVGIGNLNSSGLHSSSTVDQQTIEQSNFRAMPDEEVPNVCSLTEKENKDKDEDTDWFRQDEYLQGKYFASQDLESSITPEITTEKHSSREHTEPECSVEQEICSSPKEELHANEGQNKIFNLPKVKGDYYSEVSVNKLHEQDVEPTENQEMPKLDYSSESVMHDATDNSENISGNLMNQTEVSDKYQSELTVKNPDDSPTNRDNSNPDNIQDEHPTEENHFEASEQKNDDFHVFESREPQISDIERVDTALSQVFEMEGRVEGDTKPSAEQTGQQEQEALLSEPEESASSLQTLQSEVNVPFDSQPQQNDTSFNSIGNRRKLGSSRRNKGRQHVKDSVAESDHEHKEEDVESTRGNESDHEPTEDVVGKIGDNETLETTEMTLIVETAVQEKSMETLLEETDKFDTAQTEDVTDQVKENAQDGTLVGIGNLNSSGLHSSSTVDQQTIEQSHFREMPDEEVPNVCSLTEKENKDKDEDTDWFRQDEYLQGKYFVSQDLESSITPEITTEKHSSREHTEPECSVEQEICSSPKEELYANEGQNKIFNLPKVKGDYYSEVSVNKLHEQDVEPTENQEMPKLDYSSESVMHDATENSENISGNLMNQTEVSDKYQSELTVKNPDDSPTNRDNSNPENIQDEHPLEENHFEASEQKNNDFHVYESREPQISDIERVDTALSQVFEMEGRVEGDTKPSAEQTGQQEQEALLSETEQSASSLQTLQSEVNVPFDSQPQPNDTSFISIGNRRKLGSSRRNKGRQHVKDSVAESDHEHKEEDVESTRGNEAFDTVQMSLPIERTSHEELSQESQNDIMPATHDSSLYSVIMPGYSSEVQSPTLKDYSEAVLDSLISKSENLQEDYDERENDFKVEVSDKSVEATLEGEDTSDALQSQEFRGDHHIWGAVNKLHEQDVEPTENQEMPELDYSSESVTHNATDISENISGNLRDETEVSDTYQSELTVENTDDCPTNRDNSNPDNIQDEHPLEEHHFEASEQKNDDFHVYESREPQISDIERVDTVLSQVFEMEGRVEGDTKPSAEQTGQQEQEGLLSETEESASSLQTLQTEVNVPFDSQPQPNDTSFNSIGNRRKLGSSRRNKGRQHVKDSVAESDHEPTEDVVGNIGDNETLETTEMTLIVETAVQEKSIETLLEETDKFDTAQTEDVTDQVKENAQDGRLVGIGNLNSSGLQSSSTVDQQTIEQSHFREMPDEEVPNVCFESREPQISDIERVDTALSQVFEMEGRVERDTKPSAEQTGQQEQEGLLSETEESASSLQTLQSEINVNFDSQHQQNDTSFNSIGNRRKLGSSRRNKGRQHVKDSVAESDHKPTEDGTRGNEAFDTVQMSLPIERTSHEELSQESQNDIMPATHDSSLYSVIMPGYSSEVQSPTLKDYSEAVLDSLISKSENLQEDYDERENDFKGEVSDKSVEDMLEETDKFDTAQTEDVTDQVKENAQDGTLVGIANLNSSGLQSSSAVDQQTIEQSLFREMPDEEVPNVYSETEKEYEEKNEDTDWFRPDGNLKGKYLLTESHVKSEDIESSITLEINTEKSSQKERNEIECGVEQADFSSSEEKLPTNEEQEEHVNLTQVRGTWHSQEAVNNVHEEEIKPTQMQERHQTDNTSIKDSESNLLKLQSEMNAPLDSQPLDHDKPKTNDTSEIVVNVPIKDCKTGVEGIMYVQDYEQDEDGAQFEDPTKKENEAQEMNVSKEMFSAPHNKTDATVDIGLKDENLRAEPAVDVSEESGISSQQEMQEKTNLNDSENLQGRSKQKRRKMGSTRRTQLNRKPEEERVETKKSDREADVRNLDKMEVVEELTMIATAEVTQNENAKPSLSLVYKEQMETNETSTVDSMGQKLQSSDLQSNMMPDKDYSNALPPEQSGSHNEDVVDPVKFVQVADVEPSQRDEMLITSAFAGRNTNTRISGFVSLCETTHMTSTQNDEERPESVNIIQDHALKSTEALVLADLEIVKSVDKGGAGEENITTGASKQEPDNANEGAHNENREMKNTSSYLDTSSRRRKMGSTRRNLRTGTKQEELHQKLDVTDEATETATNVGESFSSFIKDELQLDRKHKDGGSETIEYSHSGESHKPLAHQTFEENPVSQGQLLETEHQLTPSDLPAMPSTSPKHDLISESASAGRRRKMGSHRKSHGHQNYENQTAGRDRITDTPNERDVRSIGEESAIKTEELDKISKVDKSHKKPFSNLSTSNEGEQPRPVSEKTPESVTPVQHHYAEHQQKLSLASRDLRSKPYNVMMVGDSSVGKTSFMKRAQSGKFSLDIPASIGLDSCMWTVVVEGKPVVLQLWDTAGQERFHSITRQIFYKADAFLLMYDVTSSQSFSAVSYWASCIQEGAAESVTILLVGNKSDRAERQVQTQEAENLAKENNFEFTECSAATGENVVQSLETVARMLSQKVDLRGDTMVLHKEPQPKTSRCC